MMHYVGGDEHRDIVALYGYLISEAPLIVLQYKVDRMLGRVESNTVYDQLKLFIHEAHEGNIYGILAWLNATNLDGNEIADFASSLQVELFYSESCFESPSQEDKEHCIGIQIMLDGRPLEFEGTCAEPAFCTYAEFAQYYREHMAYDGPFKESLEMACN